MHPGRGRTVPVTVYRYCSRIRMGNSHAALGRARPVRVRPRHGSCQRERRAQQLQALRYINICPRRRRRCQNPTHCPPQPRPRAPWLRSTVSAVPLTPATRSALPRSCCGQFSIRHSLEMLHPIRLFASGKGGRRSQIDFSPFGLKPRPLLIGPQQKSAGGLLMWAIGREGPCPTNRPVRAPLTSNAGLQGGH